MTELRRAIFGEGGKNLGESGGGRQGSGGLCGERPRGRGGKGDEYFWFVFLLCNILFLSKLMISMVIVIMILICYCEPDQVAK